MDLPAFVCLASLSRPAEVATPTFEAFGQLHLWIILATFLVPLALSWLVRGGRRLALASVLATGLAVVLVADRVLILSWAVAVGRVSRWQEALPMQMCDWAQLLAAAALLWRRPLCYELAYFWGLGGALQALLTPEITVTFPDPAFLSFFVGHSGIIAAVLFLTFGLGWRPRPGAVFRAMLWSQVYLVGTFLVDWLTQTNYGFLMHKPHAASILNLFGPWPWYLLQLEGFALVVYSVLYLPVWVARRWPKKASVGLAGG